MDYQRKIVELVSRMDEQDPNLERLYHTAKKMARNHRPDYRREDVAPPARCKHGKP